MKYSIIIPVYNVEKYIAKCLDSVLSQSYNNFEAIVVNDGTPDNSQQIIDEYAKKDNRIKPVIKENGGLSDARNYGLKYASGDYIIFLDSDDYIEKDLLKEIDKKATKKQPDLIKFRTRMVDENGHILNNIEEEPFDDYDNNQACTKLLQDGWMVIAWIYAYKREFWEKHNFLYPVGKIHEDIGLTPYILMCASSVCSINYVGHNYVQREGSIMSNKNLEKNYKYALDILYHYNVILEQINNSNLDSHVKKLMRSYIANIVIRKCTTLEGEYLNNYIKLIKNNKVIDNLMSKTMTQKIKKILIKINLKLYTKTILKWQCKGQLA